MNLERGLVCLSSLKYPLSFCVFEIWSSFQCLYKKMSLCKVKFFITESPLEACLYASIRSNDHYFYLSVLIAMSRTNVVFIWILSISQDFVYFEFCSMLSKCIRISFYFTPLSLSQSKTSNVLLTTISTRLIFFFKKCAHIFNLIIFRLPHTLVSHNIHTISLYLSLICLLLEVFLKLYLVLFWLIMFAVSLSKP